MLTIELKMLPGEAEAAAKFLQSKITDQIDIHGTRIQVGEKKAREVKLLLQRFLRREGLDGYRVLSESGVVRVVPDNWNLREEELVNDKVKGVPPFPPLSGERLPLMNVVYPNYSFNGSGYKKKRDVDLTNYRTVFFLYCRYSASISPSDLR